MKERFHDLAVPHYTGCNVMLDRVAASIARWKMFDPGQRVGVAVSGGADSVCLLYVLAELPLGLRLSVLHLDHGLRGAESCADAAFVAELAGRLGLPLHLERIDLSAPGDNLEQAAREARLAFFRRRMAAGEVEKVALGHTRSDQAETVLFRFLRGSGSAGLAGIRPATAEGMVRPLLEVDRAETAEYLRRRGIPWREDSSNFSLRFARNRIRSQLLPQLEREWNPSLAATLAQTAEWASAEEEYWRGEVDRLAGELFQHRQGALLLDAARLASLPLAVARRVARRAVETVKGDLRGIEFQHISAVLELAAAPDGHGRTQAPGVDVFRSFDWLRLAPAAPHPAEERNFRLPLAVPGVTRIPGADAAIHTELIETTGTIEPDDCVYNGNVGCLDWRRVSGEVELRNWRPGDQYQPIGHSGDHKIKALFHQARVPLWERRHWPVITAGGRIVWSRRFGVAVPFAAGPQTKLVLRVREQPGIGSASGGV